MKGFKRVILLVLCFAVVFITFKTAETVEVHAAVCIIHKWTLQSTTGGTCTSDKVATYRCTKCGKTKTEVLEKAKGSHSLNRKVEAEATCTSEGKVKVYCSNCSYVTYNYLPALNHNLSEFDRSLKGPIEN